jgi:hypothetical protein
VSEFSGVIVRGNRTTFTCCACGLFIKHGEQEARVIPQFGEPHDPEYEFVHRQCPPRKRAARSVDHQETVS